MSGSQHQKTLQRASSLREAGHIEEAMALLVQILSVRPESAEALLQSGLCLLKINANEAAANAFHQALTTNPELVDAQYQLGIAQRRLNQIASALSSFQRAMVLDSTHANACYRAANCLVELGQLPAALEHYDAAIKRQGTIAIFYFNRGVVLRKMGRADEAIASYEQALALDPGHGDSHFNRANLLWESGRRDEAAEGFKVAAALKPVFGFRPLLEEAKLLANLDRWVEAEPRFEAALAMVPNDPALMAHVALGLSVCRNFDRALAVIGRAISLEPQNGGLLTDRAAIFRSMGALDEAMTDVREGLRLSPDIASAYVTLGAIHRDSAEYELSTAAYRRALDLDPNLGVAKYNLAFNLLTAGEYEEGFALYEWRLEQETAKADQREFLSPKWDGQRDLAGRVLLVHAEQGLGDVIQFSRYAQMLAAKGVKVVLEAPPPLAPILFGLDGVHQVYISGETPPAHDFHYPIMSLPHAMGTRLDTIPVPTPYINVKPERVATWATRLGKVDLARVGLVWTGSMTHPGDLRRSLRLCDLRDLLSLHIEFHALQKEFRADDRPVLDALPQLRIHAESLTDFGETAAVLSLMDLLITVDTSVAHLAGALGKEVWILLPFAPDWRWLLDRTDSPWYPSARLFRQQSLGDWASVLAGVKAALLARFPGCA